jgi:predicted ester cyclase
MSREQKVAVVEAYLDCFRTKDLSKVSFAEDVTFEGPRMPKLTGRATILGFLTQILPEVKGIQLKQHIVEGDYVATIFDMETVNGVDHVFDRIHIVDGQIKAIHAFYYPEQPPEGQTWSADSAVKAQSSKSGNAPGVP